MSRIGALALIAGMTALAAGVGDPFETGRKLSEQRRCPRCGGKAIWHETTAYCTKSRCGWFEVVKAAPRRSWSGPYVHRFILTCHECGRSIVPGERLFSDAVSGHIVRHIECHQRAETNDSKA